MIYFITIISFFCLLLSAGLGFLTVGNSEFDRLDVDYFKTPVVKQNSSSTPAVTAKSILVLDNNSGAVLFEKNATSTLPIASITKLMTALVVLDTNPDWEKVITISELDEREGGMVYLVPGDEVKIKNLFGLMLISSTNEAAAALARTASTTDFVLAMNQKAKSLGLNNTVFFDPTGLDPRNVSTTNDLARLAQAAFLQPEITKNVLQSEYEFKTQNFDKKIKVASTDRLLESSLNQNDYKIIGAKTGHLPEVGYCLLLSIQRRDNKNLTLVLLGSQTDADRWQEAKSLADWVLKNYYF